MFLEMPEDWNRPTLEEFEKAKANAVKALAHEGLARYYKASRNYAGTTFWRLGQNPSTNISPDDILSVTLLSVQVGPHGVRSLLTDSAERDAVVSALAKLEAPSGQVGPITLATATSEHFLAAWELHVAF